MWIGLDIGTTAVKAAAYASDGTMRASASASAKVIRAGESGIEQDMLTVWETVCGVLQELSGKIRIEAVKSIGVAAQGDGLWAVDAADKPVAPAILWNDTRAAQDMIELTESGKTIPVAHASHTSLWPGTSGVIWRWLRSQKTETTQKAERVFTCADWVVSRLTGTYTTDFSNASIPFLDLMTRQYSQNALEALDCADLATKLLPPRRANEKSGNLTAKASSETGLPEGLTVSVGTLDLGAMMVGMGLDTPGQAMMIIGTTAVVNILTDKIAPTDVPVGATALHPVSDAIIRILAPTTGAGAFDWFASLHPASLGGASVDEVAAKINALVSNIPPGANGVVFLPYLNGERAPFVEPDIRASFTGMSAKTNKADLGRAIMEGTGFSLRHCIEEEGGLPDGPIQLTGGGSKNAVWCQIIADIIGQPVQTSAASDQGLWGAACIGASAAGFGTPGDLCKRDEKFTTYTPNPDAHAAYHGLFERYKIYSDASRQTSAALRKLETTE